MSEQKKRELLRELQALREYHERYCVAELQTLKEDMKKEKLKGNC